MIKGGLLSLAETACLIILNYENSTIERTRKWENHLKTHFYQYSPFM